ncbi:MAG TPA: VWA domain-containing protein [Bryobacteraceae bacterium]|nr:VWA domain-containing protein [Bryobacteraceae bacterium]
MVRNKHQQRILAVLWIGRVFAAALLVLSPALPQTPSPSVNDTVRVTTHLVQINVVVTDHAGNPVQRLMKDNFTLLDQGKQRIISSFSTGDLKATAASAPHPPERSSQASKLATNRPPLITDGGSQPTVLLFDMYNTKGEDQIYAKQQILRFLRQISSQDRIAIYALTPRGFALVHDFSDSPESLASSVDKLTPRLNPLMYPPGLFATGQPGLDQAINAANGDLAYFDSNNQALDSSKSLQAIANHLAGIPGRKNMIWISAAFPLGLAQLFGVEFDYLTQAVRTLATANVAVYPIDARGLLVPPMADVSSPLPLAPDRAPLGTQLDDRNFAAMQYIARETGGEAIYNRNDIWSSIRRAIADSAASYTLGYYVSESDWDGRFHTIKVKANRPGLIVRTKVGYFATKPHPLDAPSLEQTANNATWSPVDSTAIGIVARLDADPASPAMRHVFFAVRPSDVQFTQKDRRYLAALDVWFVLRSGDGIPAARYQKSIDISATADEMKIWAGKGLIVYDNLTLGSGTESLRIIVIDRRSGAYGSLTLPVSARN